MVEVPPSGDLVEQWVGWMDTRVRGYGEVGCYHLLGGEQSQEIESWWRCFLSRLLGGEQQRWEL